MIDIDPEGASEPENQTRRVFHFFFPFSTILRLLLPENEAPFIDPATPDEKKTHPANAIVINQ